MFTQPLAYAAVLALFVLIPEVGGEIVDATRDFRADGMTLRAALLRATLVVVVGGPLRLARRLLAAATDAFAVRTGITRADLPNPHNFVAPLRPVHVDPKVAARVADLRPATVHTAHVA